jgi:hypothetical protein
MNANLIAARKMAGPPDRRMATQARAATLNGHEHDRETIVALGSDSLDRRGTDAGLGGEHFIEPAYPLDIGIVACSINYLAVAHDIIDDDETAPRR